jgi:hypothetical protein
VETILNMRIAAFSCLALFTSAATLPCYARPLQKIWQHPCRILICVATTIAS